MEWPSQLKKALNRLYPYQKIEVLNASMAGLRLEGSKEYFIHRVQKFNPDILLYYQGFVSYLNKDFVEREISTEVSAPSIAPNRPSDRFRTDLNDLVNKTRIYPKFKQAIKDKRPHTLVNWIRKKQIERSYKSIDQEKQYKSIDGKQIGYYKAKLREFVVFLRENGTTVILSEHDNKILGGSDSKNVEALVSLWKYYPRVSSKVLREGYPVFNGIIREVAVETGSYFVEQKSLSRKA
jgi:hypothetical protein